MVGEILRYTNTDFGQDFGNKKMFNPIIFVFVDSETCVFSTEKTVFFKQKSIEFVLEVMLENK